METCRIPVRFPASSLNRRSYGTPRSVSIGRPRLCVASSQVRKESDEANLGFKNRMFIMGMGFVGEFFAQHLKKQGWAVSGTCTSVSKKEKLKKLGFNVHVFDANHPELEVLNIVNQHTHFLVSIPPCKGFGDPMLQHAELLRKTLNNENLRWLSYLSTTGVYGDCGGAWVDENYKPNPPSELAKLRLAAEEGWLSLGHDLGLASYVFRLGGIYGPGRSAIDTITKQDPLSEVQRARSFKKYTSRIHVADICNVLDASLHRPSPGRVYNIVDDDPAPRTQVFSFAHKLVSEKWPSHVKNMTSPYTTESNSVDGGSKGEKRVCNARMKEELGVSLLHPSYRSGLESIIKQMHNYPCNPSGSCD